MSAIDKHETLTAWEGVVYTMNIRFWEFDPNMKKYLQRSQAHAIDMETATLFVASMRRRLKIAAFHLVSDLPLKAVKDKEAAKRIIRSLGPEHVKAACDVLLKALGFYEHRVSRRRATERSTDGIFSDIYNNPSVDNLKASGAGKDTITMFMSVSPK